MMGAHAAAVRRHIPGTRTFKTDWGGTTTVDACGAFGGATPNASWTTSGGDNGFTFMPLVNGGSSFVHAITYGPSLFYDSTSKAVWTGAGGTGTEIFLNQIESRVRYDDASGSGKVLHLGTWGAAYTGSEQLVMELHPGSDVTDLYMIQDMELPSDLVTRMTGNNSNGITMNWWEIFSTKTADYSGGNAGFRSALYVYADNGSPNHIYWNLSGDNNAGGGDFWSLDTNHTGNTVPLGVPFRLEWAWHKANASTYPTVDSGCWMWVKINGSRLLRQDGPGSPANSTTPAGFMTSASPINRIFIPNNYTPALRPVDMYIGRWEIYGGANFDSMW
jgi:hypothetical protein